MGTNRTAGRPPDEAKPILIRHLTADEVDKLKDRANSNIRSMSAEATMIIRQALADGG